MSLPKSIDRMEHCVAEVPKSTADCSISTNQELVVDDQPRCPQGLFESTDWSMRDFDHVEEIGRGKDTIIYKAVCLRLGGGMEVAIKVYDRSKVTSTKLRAIKREIAMMMYFSRKRYDFFSIHA